MRESNYIWWTMFWFHHLTLHAAQNPKRVNTLPFLMLCSFSLQGLHSGPSTTTILPNFMFLTPHIRQQSFHPPAYLDTYICNIIRFLFFHRHFHSVRISQSLHLEPGTTEKIDLRGIKWELSFNVRGSVKDSDMNIRMLQLWDQHIHIIGLWFLVMVNSDQNQESSARASLMSSWVGSQIFSGKLLLTNHQTFSSFVGSHLCLVRIEQTSFHPSSTSPNSKFLTQ